MAVDRRTFLATATAAAAIPTRLDAQAAAVVRPEDFGARGDGVTNDTNAFAALAARIQAMGGGSIALSAGRTYIVGRQAPGRGHAFSPQPLIDLEGLVRPLSIFGNGARLKAAAGLRFGAFDPATGQPVHRPMPNYSEGDRASPYSGMISVRGSRAPISIQDIELDGNAAGLRLGGHWGDIGWQVPGSGLLLRDNLAQEVVVNVFSHHHPLDGVMIDGAALRSARSRFEKLVCRSNGRQGLSLVGGTGHDFVDCEFSQTGRAGIASAPGAGFNIEAETKPVRDVTFTRCKFVDNSGVGLLAESGDSAGVRCVDCMFIGTTSWAAWPRKPGFLFEGCTFAGSVVNPFPSSDPGKAAQFVDCRFTDDVALSPTGRLYVAGAAGNGIVNMGTSDNVRFTRCRFELGLAGVLPWGWRAIYEDCTMRQVSRTAAMTKGKYVGRSVIDGPVDLYGSMIVGTVILNGRTVPRGPVGSDIRAW